MRRARSFALAAALLAAPALVLHCGGGGQSSPGDLPLPERVAHADASSDAASDGDPLAPEDAAPLPDGATSPAPCDTSKPFGAPVRVAGINPALHAATPRLSHDELTVYFTTRSTEANRTDSELAKASRASRTGAFGPVTILAQSSTANDNDPAPGADHLTLWFHSARSGNADLYMATRPSAALDFGAPAPVTELNTTAPEAHAYYRQGGGELWFVSLRGTTGYDIYVSKHASGGFLAPTMVAELSSAGDDWQPQPSEDGLRILFASNRAGGKGKMDLYMARRASATAAWDAPVALDELNTAAVDQAGFVSDDGCRIYFSSGRDTADANQQIFVAERPK